MGMKSNSQKLFKTIWIILVSLVALSTVFLLIAPLFR
jgi:hypothetical protein